jgi:4-hydroxybenzoate polyprenyltransferase/phosphoserine phosphatase
MANSEPNTQSAVDAAGQPLPLVVDLDGTLVYSDLLWECVALLLKRRPHLLLMMPFWLLFHGRAGLKRRLAERAALDPGQIVFNKDLMEFLAAERARGRMLVLATAADQKLAEAVAARTGLFHRVHGSSNGRNLKGKSKADLLRATYGECGFEYAGNSVFDLPIWKIAAAAYVVGSERTARQAAAVTELRRHFPREGGSFACWSRAIRVHHWSKNLLMAVPLLLAHRVSWETVLPTLAGMLLFGLGSSGVYVLNDLLDLHSDRAHPWKSQRPFASGELSIASGIFTCLLLLGGAFGVGALLLGTSFAWVLACYLAVAITYSMWLKTIAIFDVFVLTSFYAIRLFAGAVITETPLSQWFLGFSLFFFLSLSMAKRYSELLHAAELAESGASGRSYRASDRDLLMIIGIASCFAAIVILSLYVHSSDVTQLYARPQILFLLCPLVLYWTCRIWLKAHRGELDSDPITVAIRDPLSYGVAAASLAVMLLATGGISL